MNTPLKSLLVGKLALGAALKSNSRRIFRLYLSESLPDARRQPFHLLARERGTPVESVTPEELTALSGVENHGGVAAEVGRRVETPAEEVVEYLASLPGPPLVFALEGFHEPHNLGYALRCVEALGADAVFLSPNDWGEGEVVLSQSSGGAYDRLHVAPIPQPKALCRRLEEIGIEAVSATAGAYRSFYDFDLRAPVMIAVGGEFRGLSDAMKKACRHSAHLPMGDTIPSFPAGHAAAILASEAARQRREGGKPGALWSEKLERSPRSSGLRRGKRTPEGSFRRDRNNR